MALRLTFLSIAVALSGVSVATLSSDSSCSGPLGAFGWTCATVDGSADNHSFRLTYASDGTPHIVYSGSTVVRNRVVTALKAATRDPSGAWSVSTVDQGGGFPTAIRVNPLTGRPGISYGCAKFAERGPSGWTTQVVASPKSCGGTTFAYDPGGVPYLAYSDAKTKWLRVGLRSGSSWSFQTLSRQAYKMSIDMASGGRPAVAIEDLVSRNLVYLLEVAPGVWQYETVAAPAPGSYIGFPTLKFDPDGVPTISYWTASTLRFAQRDPETGTWAIEVVIAENGMNHHDLDYAAGEPVISARRWNPVISRQYVSVSRRDATVGVWHTSVVTDETGNYADVGFDPLSGLVGVAYDFQPDSTGTLRLAEGPALAIGQ